MPSYEERSKLFFRTSADSRSYFTRVGLQKLLAKPLKELKHIHRFTLEGLLLKIYDHPKALTSMNRADARIITDVLRANGFHERKLGRKIRSILEYGVWVRS